MATDNVIDLILTDRLTDAVRLLDREPGTEPLLSALLRRAEGAALPLAELRADLPDYIGVKVSYTCDLGCTMCISGFRDRSVLYEDYRYFTPDQFEALSPWLDAAGHVFFVGPGETLDSPFLMDMIRRVAHKTTHITTSGVALNRERVRALIEADLDYLTLSFDGPTAVGHGGGRERYLAKFWDKVRMIQELKQELAVTTPALEMHITINNQNLAALDDLLGAAHRHGMSNIVLIPMNVNRDLEEGGHLNEEVYRASFAGNLAEARDRVNALLDRWNAQGLRVSVNEYPAWRGAHTACSYVDNVLFFHGKQDRPFVCCGPLLMPLALEGILPEVYWNSFPFRYFRYLHYCAGPEALPAACQSCWVMRPSNYFEKLRREHEGELPAANIDAAVYVRYATASRLKQEGRIGTSKELFLKILEDIPAEEWQARVRFHLGELDLLRGDLRAARDQFQAAVAQDMTHKKAFAYLALLMRLLDPPDTRPRRHRHTVRAGETTLYSDTVRKAGI